MCLHEKKENEVHEETETVAELGVRKDEWIPDVCSRLSDEKSFSARKMCRLWIFFSLLFPYMPNVAIAGYSKPRLHLAFWKMGQKLLDKTLA